MAKQNTGALAPRVGLWSFAMKILGMGDADSKVRFTAFQRALIKSYDRVVKMTPEEAEAYRAGTGLEPWAEGTEPKPFMCWCLSRGAGKSLVLSIIALYEVLTSEYVAQQGETVAVSIVSPRMKQSRLLLSYIKGFLDRPELSGFVDSVVEGSARFTNGRVIHSVAVDRAGAGGRGTTNIAIILDECAFLMSEGTQVASDQWAAQLAGCRGVENPRGIISSSANGQAGFFYETFRENHGNADSAWETFLGPVDLARPDMSPSLLREYHRADEQAYRREFLCDFSAGSGSEKFFNQNQVEACVKAGVIAVPQSGPTVQYAAAVDPSGGANDVMTMTVVERLEDGSVRQCLARGWDPKVPCAPTVHEIAMEVSEAIAPYGISTVFGDVFGGAWVVEAFAAAGLTYETRGFNGGQKVQRASLLRELFASGRIQLLDEPIQTRELVEYEQKRLPSGAVSVNHPNTKTGSDDYLDALALAVWELVGHDVALHPPKSMEVWNSSKWKDDLFRGGSYPDISPEKSDTIAKIVAKGPGPAWTIANWSKDWRYCQCSLGELAWLCGVGPYQMAVALGRDVCLQLAWMRWILSYWICLDPDVIFETSAFPAIPGFQAVKKRLKEAGCFDEVVGYETGWPDDVRRGSVPADWQPLAVKSRDPNRGVSTAPAFPPWIKPNPSWRLIHDVKDLYGNDWPVRPWAKAVEEVFTRARLKQKEEARKLREQQQSENSQPQESQTTILEKNW